jgi:hypothetical protein
MKKLNLFLIAIMLSFASNSQTHYYKVYRAIYLNYVEDSGWVKRIDRDTKDEDLFIIIEGNRIWMTNTAESFFVSNNDTTYEDFPDHTTISFTAHDNKNEDCIFIIKESKSEHKEIAYDVMYLEGEDKNKAFEYYIKQ